MNDRWLRRAVLLAIVLLVLHAVGSWAHSVLGTAGAILAVMVVVAVSILSDRKARLTNGNSAWFVVPLALFTALPVAYGLWQLMAIEQNWWARGVEFAPLLSGFLVPVLLLLAAYLELGRRVPINTRRGASAPWSS
jgi:hypothetical protein